MKTLTGFVLFCAVFIIPLSGFAETKANETKSSKAKKAESIEDIAEMLLLMDILQDMAFLSDMDMVSGGEEDNE